MAAKSLIYEVTLDVAPEVLERFDAWLEGHVREMLQITGFLSADVVRGTVPTPAGAADAGFGDADDGGPETADPAAPQRRVVRYRVRDQQALDSYLSEHAERMRGDGLERFGEHFTASRRTYMERPGPTPGQLVVPELGYEACLNCDAPLIGTFCSSCGQRNRRRLPRVLELVGEMLGEVFEYDSRFWKTMWPLLRRPGYLTREYLDGRRVKFLPPVRLFLVLSIVFFALSGLTDPDLEDGDVRIDGDQVELVQDSDPPEAPAPDEWEMHGEGYPFLDDPALRDRLIRQMAKVQEQPELLVVAMARELPTMMLVFLPVLAFVLQMLYPIAGYRYVEHLIFSIHFHSFFFLQIILVMLLGRLADLMTTMELPMATAMEVVWGISIAVAVIWTPVYLLRSLRKVYQQGWTMTVFKFLLLNVAYLFSLLLTTAVTAIIAGLSL